MTEEPHLAVVPLPAVTGPCPDGTLLGIALVLPRDLDEESRVAVMRAIARFEDSHRTGTEEWPSIPVLLGDAGALVLQRTARTADCGDALRPTTWIVPARRWASATPIALDRNPGDLYHTDPERRRAAYQAAAACVIEAVRRIGLPAPAEVDVLRSCAPKPAGRAAAVPAIPGRAAAAARSRPRAPPLRRAREEADPRRRRPLPRAWPAPAGRRASG